MGNQILLNINDSSKLAFFIELIKNFEFVSVNKIITNKIENTFEQTDKEILEEIEQAVKEINFVKRGKLKTRPVKDLLDELRSCSKIISHYINLKCKSDY